MNIYYSLPKPFFILAPMDDVTDTVFRQIIAGLPYPSHADAVQGAGRQAGAVRGHGPDVYFTEFVNVDGLQSPGRPRLLHKLRLNDKSVPVIAQVWGLKPENYYKTTKELIAMGYAGVDINMGCPVKTVIKNGACSALINNHGLAGEIIDAVKEASGPLPVSVKTRVGFTTPDLSWPEFLLSKKLDLLSIHGRTSKQMSKVPADWRLIGRIREMRDQLAPSTLIAGNGDVADRQQGLELAKEYGLDGIMIGRGIFNDPFAFAAESPWAGWNKAQKIELYRRHIELFGRTWRHNERRIETLNKFCKVYISGFDGAKELREELMVQHSAAGLLNVLEGAAVSEHSYIPAAA